MIWQPKLGQRDEAIADFGLRIERRSMDKDQ